MRLSRLAGWVVLANVAAAGLALLAASATPSMAVAAAQGFVAWCGIG
ncbi:MAG: hypothetical protein WD800_07875 [Dehalococcoidia bacterium]